MKVIVLGGAGFIGSHIVDRLVAMGYRVFVIDNLSSGKRHFINPQAHFIKADITLPEMELLFSSIKPRLVFHLAAQVDVQKSLQNPVEDAHINILGTVNVLKCCVKAGVEKIIYASSAAAFGNPCHLGIEEEHPVNPLSFYGITKHTPEHYLFTFQKIYGLSYTVLRYANVYGIRQEPKGEGGVISLFINSVLEGQSPVIYGDGEQTRDFIYVKDVVRANIAAMDKGDNEIINIGTGVPTSVRDLFVRLKKIAKVPLQPIFAPPRAGEIQHSYFGISKAKRALGWQPAYSLEQGLNETFAYYREIKQARKQIAATR